jgi:hypothetical protein
MIEKVKHLDLNKIFKIGIAHGTMQGSSKADGQDSRYLNEDVHFIESTFDEMDYVALGHIHKFQTIGKKHRACYPSSIYSVNFSEEDDKFCLIVELDDDKTLKILPKKLNVQIVKTLKEDLNKLPPRRREILNRLNELNETLSKDKNTRWKIKFFGLRAVLEYIKEIEWHDNIKINENPTDEFSIGDIVVPETLTFEQKIKKYIKDVKGVEWSESLSDKLNIINDERLSPEEEMCQDLTSIIHVFSSRLYGLRKYKNKVFWTYISIYQKLSDDFIREFQNEINWHCISRYKILSDSFIREFDYRLDWVSISKYQKLSEDLICEYQNIVFWPYISSQQNLSENFIYKFKNKINWEYILKHQKLSENFILEFMNIVG